MGKTVALKAALVLALCTPLHACETFADGPKAVADTSVADERAVIALELAYTSATRAGTTLARAGIIDAERFKELDRKAYTALQAVRAAYRAGNSDGYALAVTELETAIREINNLLGKVT